MSRELARRYDSTATSRDRDDDDDGLDPGRLSRSELLRKPSFAVASGLVQRKARDANGVAEGAEHVVAAASSSSGMSLPDHLMRKFESSLGADLSGVRVHTGDVSAAANDAVGAKAYTLGSDIHFAAGQYDPSSADGERLLAHEVAHTVQQGGGAQRAQFKLAVSSPGDAMEHEADRAADAMVAGQSAMVSGASSSAARMIQREAAIPAKLPSSMDVQLFEIPLLGKDGVDLGYINLAGSISGSVSFKNKGAQKTVSPGVLGKPSETSVGVKKDGVGVGGSKELELGWEANPTLDSSFSCDSEGVHMSMGVGIQHEGFVFKQATIGPLGVSLTGISWDPPAQPTCLALNITGSVSKDGTYHGSPATVSFTYTLTVQPNWKRIMAKVGEIAAEALTADAAAAAAAIALPLGVFATGLVLWAQSGHEFDGLAARVESLRNQCDAAAHEALSGQHIAINIPGQGDLAKSITPIALAARAKAAAILGMPEAAVIAAGRKSTVLVGCIADMIWDTKWPGLKTELLKAYIGHGDYDLVYKYLNGYTPNSVEKMGQKA